MDEKQSEAGMVKETPRRPAGKQKWSGSHSSSQTSEAAHVISTMTKKNRLQTCEHAIFPPFSAAMIVPFSPPLSIIPIDEE
jgi:hypothetical protein